MPSCIIISLNFIGWGSGMSMQSFVGKESYDILGGTVIIYYLSKFDRWTPVYKYQDPKKSPISESGTWV